MPRVEDDRRSKSAKREEKYGGVACMDTSDRQNDEHQAPDDDEDHGGSEMKATLSAVIRRDSRQNEDNGATDVWRDRVEVCFDGRIAEPAYGLG